MDSVLIVSHSEKNAESLAGILAESSLTNITTISNAGEARRLLIENDFDLCLINTPLPDDSGESLAECVVSGGTCQVILLVKSEHFDEVSHKVEDYGVITIAKPINKALLWNALKIAQVTQRRVKAMQKENMKLEQKINDIRIVNRAKCILISNLSLSEAEAHRYIEKQAMDMRITRREVAEELLRTYEY
ncbi:MAG: ANTAR domain-containing protein [Oscillospiraceae bacterium]|jgi:response regulator NasT|nr:ANTAR domain-containing protein [Oscillospiraceae bacterium]